MPNVIPRGLFAQSASTWKPPLNVYARVAGVWTPAIYVWAFHNGAWQLIWGAQANSPSAAPVAAYVNDGSVTVTWAQPSPPSVDAFEVRRADGSLVGTVSASITTITDFAPRPLNGPYRVAGVLEGLVAPTATASNLLNLAVGPASVSAAMSGSTAVINWTAPAYGRPTNYQVLRDGVAVSGVLPGTTLTFSDTAPVPGSAPSYTVVAILAGVNGGTRAASVNVIPLPPTNVNISTPVADVVSLGFWGPNAGTWTNFRVEVYDGAWTFLEYNTSGSSNYSTTHPNIYMRVRTEAPGGVSDWVQVGPITPKPPVDSAAGAALYVTSNNYQVNLMMALYGSDTGKTYECQTYLVSFPGWGIYNTSGTPHTVTGGEGGTWVFSSDMIQLSQAYMRCRQVRNGVGSDWVQYGPVAYH